ncbi:MAG: hypothetical protein ACLTTO_09865 [Lachnospiraceae bacterium]
MLEVRDKEIDELMMQEEVFTNVAKCVELNKEKTAINEELGTALTNTGKNWQNKTKSIGE